MKPDKLHRAIFAACKRAGLDNEARHAVQLRVTGKASLTEMDDGDKRKLLRHLNNGRDAKWTGPERPEPDAGVKVLTGGPHDSKLLALWASGYHLGVVRDPGAEALASWMKRQTGLDSLQWARPQHTAACIEALKDWLARDGGVFWQPYPAQPGAKWPTVNPRARVIEAIWAKLHIEAPCPPGVMALADWCQRHHKGDDYKGLPTAAQDDLIRKLGAWLRQVRKESG